MILNHYCRISSEILPKFLFELTELKSLLLVQAKTVSDVKAKLMGIAMTGGITLGQLFVKHFTGDTGACCPQ